LPYCSKCGTKVKDEDKFCTVCGTPVTKVVREETGSVTLVTTSILHELIRLYYAPFLSESGRLLNHFSKLDPNPTQ